MLPKFVLGVVCVCAVASAQSWPYSQPWSSYPVARNWPLPSQTSPYTRSYMPLASRSQFHHRNMDRTPIPMEYILQTLSRLSPEELEHVEADLAEKIVNRMPEPEMDPLDIAEMEEHYSNRMYPTPDEVEDFEALYAMPEPGPMKPEITPLEFLENEPDLNDDHIVDDDDDDDDEEDDDDEDVQPKPVHLELKVRSLLNEPNGEVPESSTIETQKAEALPSETTNGAGSVVAPSETQTAEASIPEAPEAAAPAPLADSPFETPNKEEPKTDTKPVEAPNPEAVVDDLENCLPMRCSRIYRPVCVNLNGRKLTLPSKCTFEGKVICSKIARARGRSASVRLLHHGTCESPEDQDVV